MSDVINFANKVQIQNRTNGTYVKIDDEWFPWITNGIEVTIDAEGRKHLRLAIPFENVVYTVDHADDSDLPAVNTESLR